MSFNDGLSRVAERDVLVSRFSNSIQAIEETIGQLAGLVGVEDDPRKAKEEIRMAVQTERARLEAALPARSEDTGALAMLNGLDDGSVRDMENLAHDLKAAFTQVSVFARDGRAVALSQVLDTFAQVRKIHSTARRATHRGHVQELIADMAYRISGTASPDTIGMIASVVGRLRGGSDSEVDDRLLIARLEAAEKTLAAEKGKVITLTRVMQLLGAPTA
jgi:hypothetical protein